MCELHSGSLVLTARGRVRRVDVCLRALIQHLNENGIMTFDSCCGHGRSHGHVTIGEEDAERARSLGFRLCVADEEGRAEYPFSAADHRVNVILPPVIPSRQIQDGE
jgi:hypothetical protein